MARIAMLLVVFAVCGYAYVNAAITPQDELEIIARYVVNLRGNGWVYVSVHLEKEEILAGNGKRYALKITVRKNGNTNTCEASVTKIGDTTTIAKYICKS